MLFRSHSDVWPEVAEWYFEKSPADPVEADSTDASPDDAVQIEIDDDLSADADTAEADEADAETAEDSDTESVETLAGIGPTYAERLGDAGLGTVDALGAADAETIAETANVSVTRAEEWLAQIE